MRLILGMLVCLLPATEGWAQPGSRERVVESIVPWLDYNSSCWSMVEVHNLGDREVLAEVEAHKNSGALIPLLGGSGIQVRLRAGTRREYKLGPSEVSGGAWVKVREKIPSLQLSPVLAVSGATECLSAGELLTTVREVAWPLRNPWVSGDLTSNDDGIIGLINTSERPAQVQGCYSSPVQYSVPRDGRPVQPTTLCSATIQELLPPFASRQVPLIRKGQPLFSLRTRGDAIVLQMLRPAGTVVKVYHVDTTVTFGDEALAPGVLDPVR